ncbi:HlyD family secretion protein [Pelistega sp. NLN82]|uniref:HlyD family secretion protein n=1 Tax=Pelistega ratti TaxID=2652177 RepID=A0A6L9Y6R8_9BURK|nr:HlyD family secretion protein [Pelistega ratti]NEN75885.1 HlyD family secretion protein [Pelistega ratti]
MELMILIVYTAICVGIFKLFKIPLNKWSVPTAILGGVTLLVSMLLFMNYNHPHTKLATQYYISTPLIPHVRGKIIEVNPLKPNQLVKKGDVLFRIDPTPYQAVVDLRKAQLVEAEQNIKSLEADYLSAQAKVTESKVTITQTQREFERYRKLLASNGVSQSDFDLKQREYLSAKATYESNLATLEKTQGLYLSKIDGVNTIIAQAKAQLDQAQFDLDSTIIKAPTDGFISQNFLKEGMTATTLPLRPVMTFTHHQDKLFMAAFRQNSLLRLSIGNEAELAFPAIPGKVFKAEVIDILPTIGEHEVQANGTLYTRRFIDENAMPLVLLKITDERIDEYDLPYGTSAEVAVYTEHAHHLAMMRKILLRMNSWKNYLYLDH